jgi:hypothetical protein
VKPVQDGFRDSCLQALVCTRYKTDGAANEDALEIKFAVPLAVGLFWYIQLA